jgi:hypothetical protein
MKTILITLTAIFYLAGSGRTSRGEDGPVTDTKTRQKLKDQAAEIAKAVVAADFEKVADMTHPASLEMFGGRDKAIALQKEARAKTVAIGGKIQIERVEDPGEIVESRSVLYSYVPVVARVHCPMPKQVLLAKSFFIAVSKDQGKTWKFVDDAGIPAREFVAEMLPDWPSKLKLPPKEPPTKIEE